VKRVSLGGAWIATVVLAYLIGARPHGAPVVVHDRVVTSSAPSLSAAEVRAIVHDELAAAQRVASPMPVAAAAPAADPPSAPEPSPRFAEARQLVENALARGLWTEADRGQLRVLLSGLQKNEIDELFAMLVPAVNAGQVKVDYFGSPL
jgi:hypothetical protein